MNEITPDMGTTRLQPLIPPSVQHYYNTKPVTWGESEAGYDALRAQIMVELNPRDTIEYILVKDVADYVWEKQRLRNMKRLSIRAKLPEALWSLIGEQYWVRHGKDYSEPDEYKAAMADKIRSLLAGGDSLKEFEALLAEYHIDGETLQYEASRWTLRISDHIAKATTDAERGLERLLKTIADRRQSLTEQSRSLVDQYGAGDVNSLTDVLEAPANNVNA